MRRVDHPVGARSPLKRAATPRCPPWHEEVPKRPQPTKEDGSVVAWGAENGGGDVGTAAPQLAASAPIGRWSASVRRRRADVAA